MNSLAQPTNFLNIYATARDVLGKLVADLDERSILEYVSSEGVLTIPLVCQGDEKSLPVIEVKAAGELLTIGLVYRDIKEIRHLKNLLHLTQVVEQKTFNEVMKLMPFAFETRLYKRSFKEIGFSLVKKLIACKLDVSLLGSLIEDTETLRSGGRKSVNGRSIYEAPSTPLLYLIYREVKGGEPELRAVLSQMRSILVLVVQVKTQREIIHSHISKPVDQANQYHNISQLLNKVRNQDLISAEERRGLEKKWREVPEERTAIEEELKRRLGSLT